MIIQRDARIDIRLKRSIKNKLMLIAEERKINLTKLLDEAFIMTIVFHEVLDELK